MMTFSNPDIGYFEQDVFDAFSFSQIAESENLVLFSGVAPLKGGLADLQLISSNSMEQLSFVLAIIEKCLKHTNLDKKNIIAWTFYTTDIQEFATNAGPMLNQWLDGHKPTSTTVEVSGLIHPKQTIEITVTAIRK